LWRQRFCGGPVAHAFPPAAGRDPAALPLFVALLQDEDAGIRVDALDFLARLGPSAQPAVPAIRASLRDSSRGVRRCAASALGEVGPGVGEARQDLLQALEDPDGGTRLCAARALWQVTGEPEPTVSVLTALFAVQDHGPDGRFMQRDIAKALGALGPPAAQAVPVLVDELQAVPEDERGLRRTILWTLGEIGPPARVGLPLLTAALSDPDEDVRFAAAQSLWTVGGDAKPALPVLLSVGGQQTRDPADRCRAMHLMGRMGPLAKAAVPMLTDALTDPDPDVRGAARTTLDSIIRRHQ
jgi:HEAT repeat protein